MSHSSYSVFGGNTGAVTRNGSNCLLVRNKPCPMTREEFEEFKKAYEQKIEQLERKVRTNEEAAEKVESVHQALMHLQELTHPEVDLEKRIANLEEVIEGLNTKKK